MAFGMNTVIDAPRPTERDFATALTAYIPGTGDGWDPDGRGIERWKHGVKFCPFGCEKVVGALFDPCVDRTSTLQERDVEISFDPFLAEVGILESTLGRDRDTLHDWALAHTRLARSSFLAAQVERAAYATGNASLASEAQDVSKSDETVVGAFLAVEEGLATLLDGAAGMIHVPPGLLSAIPGVRIVDGQLVSLAGHRIVSDAGYVGASPATQAAVEGELWIYGSGPVVFKYDSNPMVRTPADHEFFSGHNDWKVKVEQHGLAVFDPCAVVAAKVNTASSSITGEGGGISATTASVTSPADTNVNQTLAAANSDRKGLMIFNDSTAELYVKLGAVASTTDFTVKILADGYWEMPTPTYTGRVDGVWASDASGAARVTEIS